MVNNKKQDPEEKPAGATNQPIAISPGAPTSNPQPEEPKQEMVTISKKDLEKIQEDLKMLHAVADQSRVFNYEAQRAGQKKPIRIKLSKYNDKLIVGWRVIKDELVKHPTTGLTVGEVQQYEVLLRDAEGNITKQTIDGYKQFSDVRYTERVECEVVGRKEDWEGKLTLDVKLPDGEIIPLDSRFVN